jgi:hypothetical protein
MFVVEPLNLMGIMIVSRIIENVHFLHGIAVEDCIALRIFMFLKVFFESMSVVGTLETKIFCGNTLSYAVTATLS